MSRLWSIRVTAQQVAEAITDVIGVETEIVDDNLKIVAGTGRYKAKVGSLEEEGKLDSGLMYANALCDGQERIVSDKNFSAEWGAVEGEMAEVCAPVRLGEDIIGLMGLVAFDDEQKTLLLKNTEQLLNFLRRMAFLLASRVSELELTGELRSILESISEGIIAVDGHGRITSCNLMAEQLLGKPREYIAGRILTDIWPDSPVREVIASGQPFHRREEIYGGKDGTSRHFMANISPIFTTDPLQKESHHVIGAVVSFKGIAEVREMIYALAEEKHSSSFEDILSISEVMDKLKKTAETVAKGMSTVLITGESGTGKELFARAIHYASPRARQPFVTVNCGAIPDTLLESELFGYESGAFTGANRGGKAGKFELADGGTVFLDEIGDLPLHLQVKLLHVLQRREMERVGGNRIIPVDVRVVAATNRDLEEMMLDGEFREDLYFRLNVIPLVIPPLRERRDDIELLLRSTLIKHNRIHGKCILGFDVAATAVLLQHSWPGNVRELENAVEYAVNMEAGSVIRLESLPPRFKRSEMNRGHSLGAVVDQTQREAIVKALQQYGNDLSGKRQAAKHLGISETTLYRRLKALGIPTR